MYAFDYVRPASVADAVAALRADPEARLIAGGQTLIPTLKQRLASPGKLIDLGGVADLKAIRRDGGNLVIGAMATHASVAGNADVRQAIPALAKLAAGIGDPQVRHAGTLGGSIANNDPAADYPAAVLALGATIVTDRREIAADTYFTGLFQTALEAGEIVTAVRFPAPKRAGYARYEQRASRYVLVGVFVAETASGVRAAVTGCGAAGVFRVPEIEAALAKGWSADALKGITIGVGKVTGDMHGSAEYRAAMVPVLAARAVAAA